MFCETRKLILWDYLTAKPFHLKGLFQNISLFSSIFSLTRGLKTFVLTELSEIFKMPRWNNKGL